MRYHPVLLLGTHAKLLNHYVRSSGRLHAGRCCKQQRVRWLWLLFLRNPMLISLVLHGVSTFPIPSSSMQLHAVAGTAGGNGISSRLTATILMNFVSHTV